MNLKLKRTPGLFLVGFMASGKSTVGRKLASELGWHFSDLDSELEAEQCCTITQIFTDQGEEAFRKLETEALRRRIQRIRAGNPYVVALGGGAFVQPENWQLLENSGITIWLDCPLDRVKQRLGNDTMRPLAADRQALAALLERRRPIYSRADFRIEVDCDDVAEITSRILRLPIF